jgi:hypothetical protein
MVFVRRMMFQQVETINKEIEIIFKKQIEMLGLKNTIIEIKAMY